MSEPFKDVTFPTEYPVNSVADHEVLMAFRNDCDAIRFREWWNAEGATAFAAWQASYEAWLAKRLDSLAE